MQEIEIVLEKEKSSEIEIKLESEGNISLPSLENLEVTPSKEQQVFRHKNSYGYDKVTVDPIPDNYIIPNGTKDIITNGYHQVSEYEGVNVDVKVIPNLQDKEVTPTKEIQNITSDEGFNGLNEVTVNPIPEEYIIPNGTLEVTENITYDVTQYSEVVANVVSEINLQDKTVTPTKEAQEIEANEEYDGLNKVIVEPIPDKYIIPDGILDVNANGDVDVTMFRIARVGVYTPPKLQTKEVTPTKELQVVGNDEEYDGLDAVVVNPIPNEYIVPSGSLDITENGIKDVTSYAEVNVNIEGKEDLTEELNTYNTELTEQEIIINNIIEALKNKTSNKEVE